MRGRGREREGGRNCVERREDERKRQRRAGSAACGANWEHDGEVERTGRDGAEVRDRHDRNTRRKKGEKARAGGQAGVA